MVTRFQLLFIFICLSSLSACTDHQMPPKVSPVISIDPTWEDDNQTPGNHFLKVVFNPLGNQSIKEYGIIVAESEGDGDLTPTVSDRKIVFVAPPVNGVNALSYPVTSTYPTPVDKDITCFFRAYAELEDNTVIYGSAILKIVLSSQPL